MMPDALFLANNLVEKKAKEKGDHIDGGAWRKQSMGEIHKHLVDHIANIGRRDKDDGFDHAVNAFVRLGQLIQKQVWQQQRIRDNQ